MKHVDNSVMMISISHGNYILYAFFWSKNEGCITSVRWNLVELNLFTPLKLLALIILIICLNSLVRSM